MNVKSQPLIYLVDDDEDDQYLVEKALLHIDFVPRLECFLSGRACLERLFAILCEGNEELPDLILLDVNMPKMDGKEVLAKIKNNLSLNQIPVVIYTTSSSEVDVIDVYALGANSCISKPGSFYELVGVMKNICDFWLSKSKSKAMTL